MVKRITDPANDNYSAGLEFNYAVWTEQTEVSLTNVPWNNDYRDVVFFPGDNVAQRRAALNTFIDTDSEVTNISISYAKTNEPIRISAPYNTVINYNYLRARNPLQPVTGDIAKDYYYFIRDVIYVAPNNTQIIVELDVWTTYWYDATLGNCYVERGHIGIANTLSGSAYGRDFLTIPEGLDVGSEYQVIAKKRIELMAPADIPPGIPEDEWIRETFSVLVASTIELSGYDQGDETNPHYKTASGSIFQGMPSGAAYYIWDSGLNFQIFMNSIADKPWISQGIISITAIPDINRYYPEFEFGDVVAPLFGGTKVFGFRPQKKYHNVFAGWRSHSDILDKIPERYSMLAKKLMTYPYMAIELTTWGATPIVLRPEAWANDDATVMEMASLVPPNQRVIFSPKNYNAIPGTGVDSKGDDSGDFLDVATLIANFPTFAIVNNGAIGYMAANAHGLAFMQQNAEWAQQRALQGARVGYQQAGAGIRAGNESNEQNISTDYAQTQLSNRNMQDQSVLGVGAGLASGGGSGLVAGGPGAAIGAAAGAIQGAAGLASAGLNMRTADASQGLRAGNARSQRAIASGQESLVATSNFNLANYAAQGDYANAIAAINAKIQDAQVIPPTTSGQVGGEAMNLINNLVELSVRWKMIDKAHLRRVGEFFLRYGYMVQQFVKVDKVMVMTKFTYWKMQETYLIATNMPEGMKQVIRGIFEKGVTIWNDPNDIGNIDTADNAPIAGITL